MIKAWASNRAKHPTTGEYIPMVVLGLDEDNWARLLGGEAATVDLEGLGLPPSVLILMGGKSDGEMVERLTTLGLIEPGQLPELN